MPTVNVPGVKLSGPLFDGTSLRLVVKMMNEIDAALARVGLELLYNQFHRNFKNPTGYYESQVRIQQTGRYESTLTDGGVVYGPWLEGTGSRNATTRFKGYWSYRAAATQLNKASELVVESIVSRYCAQMNGHTVGVSIA